MVHQSALTLELSMNLMDSVSHLFTKPVWRSGSATRPVTTLERSFCRSTPTVLSVLGGRRIRFWPARSTGSLSFLAERHIIRGEMSSTLPGCSVGHDCVRNHKLPVPVATFSRCGYRICLRVELSRSTWPSDCGWNGVVRVFFNAE